MHPSSFTLSELDSSVSWSEALSTLFAAKTKSEGSTVEEEEKENDFEASATVSFCFLKVHLMGLNLLCYLTQTNRGRRDK